MVLRVLEDLEEALRERAAPDARSSCAGCAARPQAARLLGRRAVSLLAEGRPAAAAAVDGEAVDRRRCRSERPSRHTTARAGARSWRTGPEAIGEGRLAALTRANGGQHDGRRSGGDPAARDRAAGARMRGVSSRIADRVATRRGPPVRRNRGDRSVARMPAPDPWRPGAAASDAEPGAGAGAARGRLGRARAGTPRCFHSPLQPRRRWAAGSPRWRPWTRCSAGR